MGEGALARLGIRGRSEAELGLGGGEGLNLGAGLHLAVGELVKAVRSLEAAQRRFDAVVPVAIDFAGGAKSGVTGDLIIRVNPSGPPAGKVWHIRRLTVTGSLGSDAPAGVIRVFSGMNPPSATAGDFGSTLKDASTTAFPTSAFYDDYQLTITHPNKLYVIISGAIAASTFYGISGTAKMVADHGPGVIAYQE